MAFSANWGIRTTSCQLNTRRNNQLKLIETATKRENMSKGLNWIASSMWPFCKASNALEPPHARQGRPQRTFAGQAIVIESGVTR